MTSLFLTPSEDPPHVEPINGAAYLTKLHKYLQVNSSRLSPFGPSRSTPTILQQSYTLLTLGLDPSSAPLSRFLKVPLTLGFGQPSTSKRRIPPRSPKPLLLRLPPDRLLYLLLRWQSLPQSLNHVGRTDVPIEEGVPVAARGARIDDRKLEGDVKSVRSWVGSMRSVSMGSLMSSQSTRGWFGKKEEINEDQILLQLYSMFTILPALLIHPPFVSDPPILELIEAGGYTQLGGIDVRVPLDVMRNLQILELESYDPRALLIPPGPGMRSLTVRDVQDGDDWIEELLAVTSRNVASEDTTVKARFPNLQHLSLISTTLLNFPQLPLTSLTHLDLSNNLLDTLPASLSGLTSLTSLNLSNNVIVSLRSASSIIPQVVSLNLSGNRIDCLVGLDQCDSLRRIDIRRNELMDVGEVGRLSVLPSIKEIWCVGNPFDVTGYEDEWRIELGIAFREEGKMVVLDDKEFNWSENRKIDMALEKTGKLHQHDRSASLSRSRDHSHSHDRQTSSSSAANASEDLPPSRYNSINSNYQYQQRLSTQAPAQTPNSMKSPSSSAAAIAKKKSKRRVINLDADVDTDADGGDEGKRTLEDSLRVPGKVIEEDEDEVEDGKQDTDVNDKLIDENGHGINNGNGDGGSATNKDRNIVEDQEQSRQSIKVVSSKRKNHRKGLKKDTFDPIP
ncbi:hypothetical protein I203_103779 [Kwoniella mangroviensis CBS 8507]|uniref:uncharacterized protein n=1 Tax=Kwoniella mangroviensis CBS 8507 TaxID=1296122 RepID=UPI00080CD20C|nr:uncharacterized protein I203_04128 [Kwoniella mangroviensis CBS 8507]OCF66552.1 hypothetical protein I203_04128 [Kwoniella mangroviensis CBS 8507]